MDQKPIHQFSYGTVIFILPLWIAALCYGWAYEPFTGQLLLHETNQIWAGALFQLTQSAATNVLFFACLFVHWMVFLDASIYRRLFLFFFSAAGAFLVFFAAIGAFNNLLIVPLFFELDFGPERSLNFLKSQSGWVFAVTVWVACGVASWCWAGVLNHLRYCVNEFPSKVKWIYPISRPLLMSQVAVLVISFLYCFILWHEHLTKGIEWTYAVFLGLLFASVFSCFSLIFSHVSRSKQLAILITLIAVLALIIGFVLMVQRWLGGNPMVPSHRWLIISTAVFLTILWFSRLGLQRRVSVQFSENSSAKKVEADPLADDTEQVKASGKQVVESDQEQEQRKAIEQERVNRRLRKIPMSYYGVLLFACSVLLFFGHFLPKRISPYFYMTTGSVSFSKLMAEIKNANGGDPFYESFQVDGICKKENFLKPLFDVKDHSYYNGDKPYLAMEIEVQPFVDLDVGNINRIKFAGNWFLWDIDYHYTTVKGNGAIYSDLRKVNIDCPILDVDGMRDGEIDDLLAEGRLPGGPVCIRNLHCTKQRQGYLEKYLALGFENCQFEPDFDFESLLNNTFKINLSGGCQLSTAQWKSLMLFQFGRDIYVQVPVTGNKIPMFLHEVNVNHFAPGEGLFLEEFPLDFPREPVTFWNFNKERNHSKQLGREFVSKNPFGANKNIPNDIDCRYLTIENGSVTGVSFDVQTLKYPKNELDFQRLRWLRFPASYLARDSACYEQFQQALDQLEVLSLKMDITGLGWKPREKSIFIKNLKLLLSSPKLKTLYIDQMVFDDKEILEAIDCETIVLLQPYAIYSLGTGKRVFGKNKLKRVVSRFGKIPSIQVDIKESDLSNLDVPSIHRGSQRQIGYGPRIYAFEKAASVKGLDLEFFTFQNYNVDTRLPWQELKESAKLIKFNVKKD